MAKVGDGPGDDLTKKNASDSDATHREPSSEDASGYREMLARYFAHGLLGVSVALTVLPQAHASTPPSSVLANDQAARGTFAARFEAVRSGLARGQTNLRQNHMRTVDWIKAEWDKVIWRMFG